MPTINIPTLPSRSSLLPKTGGPSTSNVAPSNFGGGFPLPIGTTCASLLLTRQVLLSQPQSFASQAGLALNSLWLAIFHCQQISGD